MESHGDRIQAILDRNKRVEAEKAWERSHTRRGFIALLIFVTVLLLLWLINEPQFLLLSLIPVAGYIFSTLSLPWLKKRWMRLFNQ